MRLLLIFLFIPIIGISQTNLPPGAVPVKDTGIKISIDELKERISSQTRAYDTKAQFLKNLSEENLKELERGNRAEYDYYNEAYSFYQQLSENILYNLSTDELWYLYQYQPKSSDQLLKL